MFGGKNGCMPLFETNSEARSFLGCSCVVSVSFTTFCLFGAVAPRPTMPIELALVAPGMVAMARLAVLIETLRRRQVASRAARWGDSFTGGTVRKLMKDGAVEAGDRLELPRAWRRVVRLVLGPLPLVAWLVLVVSYFWR